MKKIIVLLFLMFSLAAISACSSGKDAVETAKTKQTGNARKADTGDNKKEGLLSTFHFIVCGKLLVPVCGQGFVAPAVGQIVFFL